MSSPQQRETAPTGFDSQGWPLPEVRSMMVDNFVRSWTQHWLAVVLLFVVSMGIVLFAAWLVTPTWEGQATMEIQPAPTPAPIATSNAVTQTTPLTAAQLVKNLIEQTRSLSFLREVVTRSGLDQYYEQIANKSPDLRTRIKKGIVYVGRLQFIRPAGKVDYVAKALDDLQTSWLSITPTEGSTVIPIYVYGDTPEITRRVGDTIMDLLQERTDAALRAVVQAQVDVVSKLATEAEQKVQANDIALEAARKKLPFFDPESYARQAQDELQALLSEKANFNAQSDALVAKIAQLKAQLDANPETRELTQSGTSQQPSVGATAQLEKDIANIKADIAAKSVSMGPNSPAVRQLELRRDDLQKSLEELRRSEGSLEGQRATIQTILDPKYQSIFTSWLQATSELTVLQTRVASLDEPIATMTEMQHNAVKADIELKRMQRNAQADEAQLNTLTTQLRQLNNLLATPNLFTGVVSRSDTQVLNDRKNDYPNMLLAIGLALAIGLFAGLVLPIAYDYLNQTLLTSRQVASIPGVRVVASVPHGGSNKMFASV